MRNELDQALILKEQSKLAVNLIRVMVIGLLVWNLAIIFAPLLLDSQVHLLRRAGAAIYFFMAPVCHQLPERSFFIHNGPMAVCARCFSIYLVAFFTLILSIARGRFYFWPGWIYIVLVSITGLEFIIEKADLIRSGFGLRTLSGSLVGILSARFYLESIMNSSGKEPNG